ncbi:hypothetical protein GCM10009443_00300 [Mucilaginibacter ginsenosidivorans]
MIIGWRMFAGTVCSATALYTFSQLVEGGNIYTWRELNMGMIAFIFSTIAKV